MAQEMRNVDYESMVEKYTFGQQVEAIRNGINAYSGVKKVKSLIFQFGIMPVNTVILRSEGVNDCLLSVNG